MAATLCPSQRTSSHETATVTHAKTQATIQTTTQDNTQATVPFETTASPFETTIEPVETTKEHLQTTKSILCKLYYASKQFVHFSEILSVVK